VRKLTPYQKIVRASDRGTGVRLDAEETFILGKMDDAIYYRAALDDEEQAQTKKAAQDLS